MLLAFVVLAALGGPVRADAPACSFRFERHNAIYRNGAVDLSGDWVVPDAPGPRPAAVILQGSGSSDRNNGWAAGIAEGLAKCGVAVLLTDKRGSGESGGDWRTASMDDLARDGKAGLDWVKGQPGVDAGRLGFVGLSQGGRVAPQAATLSPDADFVIDLVGSADTLKQALYYDLHKAYVEAGLTPTQMQPLDDMADAAFAYIETGRGWDDYLAKRTRLAAGRLARGVEHWPAYPEHWYWTFWRRNHDAQPGPSWRTAIETRGLSGLAVFGEKDTNADPASAAVLRGLVASDRLRIETIPGVGHSLYENGALSPRVMQLMLETISRSGGK